jgi:hypothetical protein
LSAKSALPRFSVTPRHGIHENTQNTNCKNRKQNQFCGCFCTFILFAEIYVNATYIEKTFALRKKDKKQKTGN